MNIHLKLKDLFYARVCFPQALKKRCVRKMAKIIIELKTIRRIEKSALLKKGRGARGKADWEEGRESEMMDDADSRKERECVRIIAGESEDAETCRRRIQRERVQPLIGAVPQKETSLSPSPKKAHPRQSRNTRQREPHLSHCMGLAETNILEGRREDSRAGKRMLSPPYTAEEACTWELLIAPLQLTGSTRPSA